MTDLLPDRTRSPRLLLRRWVPGDAAALSASVTRNLEHLRPWMPWIAGEPLSLAARTALLEGWERAWRSGGDVVMAMDLDGTVVGSTGLHRRQGPGTLEIGYWVDGDHLGRGLATEAASALTSLALGHPGIEAVEIHHDKANVRSGAVPARLGYSLEGERAVPVEAPGEIGVDCTWRMTRRRWAQRCGDTGKEV